MRGNTAPSASEIEGGPSIRENDSLIRALVDITRIRSICVRLWFSSQETVDIEKCFKSLGVYSVEVTAEKTAEDVQRYLGSEISNNIFPSTMESKEIAVPQSDFTFLWANSICQDIIDSRVTDERGILAIIRSVPNNISERYKSIIDRIKLSPSGPNSRRSPWPIWQIVLSMLVFARRPLRLFELMEGVAILRTRGFQDMDPMDVPNDEEILASCRSLIYLLRDEEGTYSNEVEQRMKSPVLLCHRTLRVFLEERSDFRGEDIENLEVLVSKKIIGQCCIQHLLQPKLANLLRDVGDGALLTNPERDPGEPINPNSFLFYAAKYWHEHFDTHLKRAPEEGYYIPGKPAAEDVVLVTRFLESSNFVTCIQIQSLCVEGHFLQSYNSITDLVDQAKRIIPNWLYDCSGNSLGQKLAKIRRQFEDFVGEWGELLQAGLSEYSNKSVDRCLWKALGREIFLSQRNSHFNHATFEKSECCGSEDICGTTIQRFSRGYSDLTSMTLCLKQQSSELIFDVWAIEGGCTTERSVVKEQALDRNRCDPEVPHPPNLQQKRIQVDLSSARSDIHYYGGWASRHFPIIPSQRCIPPPDPVGLYALDERALLRVGSTIFEIPIMDDSNNSHRAAPTRGGICIDIWEDIRSRGKYLVASRRKSFLRKSLLVASDCPDDSIDSDEELGCNASVSSGDESWSNGEAVEFDSEDSDGSVYGGNIRAHDTDSEDEGSENSDHLYHGGGIEQNSMEDDTSSASSRNGDTDSEPDSAFWDESESDEDLLLHGRSRRGRFGGINLRKHCPGERRPAHHIEDPGDPDATQREELLVIPLENRQRISIAEVYKVLPCAIEGCNKTPEEKFYHCPICSVDCDIESYIICYPCQKGGGWCRKNSHQLYDMHYGTAVGVIAHNCFRYQNRISVFDTSASRPKLLFNFFQTPNGSKELRKEPPGMPIEMIYESNPAIHPKAPLLAWPLTGREIILANFETKAWRKQVIERPHKEGIPICMDVSFSSCGTILRAATIEATKKAVQRPQDVTEDEKTLGTMFQISLALHVVLLEISPARPIATQAKQVVIVDVDLGPCERYLIKSLPFTFTWLDNELYITISSSRLRVYQINLGRSFPQISNTPGGLTKIRENVMDKNTVKTVKEVVFLPRSARNRKVQYLPPAKDGNYSKVIIGPRPHDDHPASIVLNLTEQDTGGWVSLEEAEYKTEGIFLPRSHNRKHMYEIFDTRGDCDLIPMSNDKW
ncbi:hypothetical protein TWF481_009878 [Arthrobotrys musiformis]|uniref:Uncharacterized protein n=1 Tax=Arthrobotrys musiformis TaxID=47236 RepID=A0AAV9WAW5_9PEZI